MLLLDVGVKRVEQDAHVRVTDRVAQRHRIGRNLHGCSGLRDLQGDVHAPHFVHLHLHTRFDKGGERFGGYRHPVQSDLQVGEAENATFIGVRLALDVRGLIDRFHMNSGHGSARRIDHVSGERPVKNLRPSQIRHTADRENQRGGRNQKTT